MVRVDYDLKFKKTLSKLKDNSLKIKIKKQIKKIIEQPEIGKPMKYERKGTRELYIKPFRLVYSYKEDELVILFLELYHKDNQ